MVRWRACSSCGSHAPPRARGGVAGGAALALGAPQRVGAAHAEVVVVAVLGRAGGARQAAGAAADQRPQQVGVAGVARGALLVGVQLGLHLGEGRLAHDLGDRHGDPLLRRPGRVALARPDRQQRRLTLPGGRDPGPVGLRPARIGRVAQHAAHAGDVPAWLTRRGRHPRSVSRLASRYSVAPGSKYQSNSCATNTASSGSTRTPAASRGRCGSSR